MKKLTSLLLAISLLSGVAACGKKNEAPDTSPTESATGASSSTAPKTPSVNDSPAPQGIGAFEMDGPAPVSRASYASMPYVLPLNPDGPQETMVRWVDGWGVSPTNAEAGTMYVLGHAWGQQKLVFNPISEVVTAHVDLSQQPQQVPADSGGTVGRYATDVLNGSHIRMKDNAGNLREWIVDNSWLVDKYDAIEDKELVNEHDPGRIILIACSVSGTDDLGYNVIVSGRLTQ